MKFKELENYGDESTFSTTMDVNIVNTEMSSLEGCFKEVYGHFHCVFNKLTSLEYCPEYISRDFNVSNNKLTLLDFLPTKIKGSIVLRNNNIISLKGMIKEVFGDLDCSGNKLTSLEYCAKIINGNFNCNYNEIYSLKHSPIIISNNFNCSGNKISSLDDCTTKSIGGFFDCTNNPELKNIKEQIIQNQIEAKEYLTDEGNFTFEDIKEEFIKYKTENILTIENIKNRDFGLSF